MNMILDANLEALGRLVANNRKAPGFDLESWYDPCGTFGCLVGNDNLACGKPINLSGWTYYSEAGEPYGLSAIFSVFLFSFKDPVRNANGIVCKMYSDGLYYGPTDKYRDCSDREAAIRRVEKLIAYVRRKRALLYEADGRVKELARRTEGNHMVLPRIAHELAAAV